MGRFAVVCGAVMPTADRFATGHFGEAALGVPGKGVKPVSAIYCWHWEHPLLRLFFWAVEKPVSTKIAFSTDTISTGIFWEIDVCIY